LPYYREDGETGYEMGTIGIDLARHPSYQVLPGDGSIPPRYACDSYIWALVEERFNDVIQYSSRLCCIIVCLETCSVFAAKNDTIENNAIYMLKSDRIPGIH
jgi:hypothetical protein